MPASGASIGMPRIQKPIFLRRLDPTHFGQMQPVFKPQLFVINRININNTKNRQSSWKIDGEAKFLLAVTGLQIVQLRKTAPCGPKMIDHDPMPLKLPAYSLTSKKLVAAVTDFRAA